jgi:hypothetical protein
MSFELESEWRQTWEEGEGISIAFMNIELRMAVSSPANNVLERHFTIARGGMISKSDGFSSAGMANGLPPNLKCLLSHPSDGHEFIDL